MPGHRNQHGNLFAALPTPLAREQFDTLLQAEGVILERIVSLGHTTPPGEWYDQAWDEWVVLLSGHATLEFEEGGSRELAPGDYLLIPAHRRHRVSTTAPDQHSVWLALHLGRPDDSVTGV